MRPAAVLSYAVATFLGQATLDAIPTIVAEREGGMGLGSALIVVGVMHVAAVAAGAILGGSLADRLSARGAALAASVVLYAGLLAVAAAPMGALDWLTATALVTGVGFGVMLTAAFTTMAALERSRRVVGVVALLVALLLARAGAAVAAPIAAEIGGAAIPVVGASIVGLVLTAAHLDRGTRPVRGAGRGGVGGGPSALIGGAVGLGTLAALAGTDPSRLSAALLAGLVGAGGLESLEVARLVLLAAGIALIAAGGLALVAAPAVRDVMRVAVPGLGLATLAASGVGSAAGLALARATPDGGPEGLGAATLAAGLAGLALGAGWLARGTTRDPAAAGGALLVLASGAVVASLAVFGDAPPAVLLGPVAVAGIGWGMVASTLRVMLTEPTIARGLAAGGGVAASAIGASLGGMVGTSLALDVVRGGPTGWSVPGAVIVLAAVAAAGIVAVGVPRVRGD